MYLNTMMNEGAFAKHTSKFPFPKATELLAGYKKGMKAMKAMKDQRKDKTNV